MDRINEIRERASKATQGEWEQIPASKNDVGIFVRTEEYGWLKLAANLIHNDADFIAHSRSDIEYLLSEIDRLKAENERLKENVPSCGCQYCLDGIDIIQIKFPTTHEYGGTWWKESVRTPKYCPMCGHRLSESPKGEADGQN